MTVRIDVDEVKPATWRRLEVRSDMTVEVFHNLIQTALGWADTHLHRFALGPTKNVWGGPYLASAADVEEGDDLDQASGVEADVVLDQVLRDVGDRLFDVDEATPLGELMGLALPPTQLRLISMKEAAERSYVRPTRDERARAVQPWLALLGMMAEGGLPLTVAGYLRPAVVGHIVDVLRIRTYGASRREMDVVGVSELRHSLRTMGYARSYRGEFVLTKRGRRVLARVGEGGLDALWSDVAASLIPENAAGVDRCARIVCALLVAAGCSVQDLSNLLGEVLHELGWVTGDRKPLTSWQCSELTWPTLRVLSAADQRWGYSRADFSPTARSLACEAMFGGPAA